MPLRVSIVIPIYNDAAHLRTVLEHVRRSVVQPYECIVVDDGSTDQSAEVARSFGAIVLSTGGRRGPAHGRNLGAKAATGDILFFIDGDVCIYPKTVAQILAHFEDDPALDALIGSYDDAPKSKDFLSQYKNLMHCFVHRTGRREACTFWSGCGAIRREVFLEHSGFNETYNRPAIEDIELGYRLTQAHRKIALDADLVVKHLKTWSFFKLLKTDIMDRGIPWTELILRDRCLPNDLNLQLSQRVSVALMFILVGVAIFGTISVGMPMLTPLLALLFLLLGRYEVEGTANRNSKTMIGTVVLGSLIVFLAWRSGRTLIIPPVLLAYLLLFLRHRYSYGPKWRKRANRALVAAFLLFTALFVITFLPRHPAILGFFLVLIALIVLNSQFYLFLAAKRGRMFALAAIPFHLLFHFYNGISFLIGLCHFYYGKLLSPEKPAPKKDALVSSKQ